MEFQSIRIYKLVAFCAEPTEMKSWAKDRAHTHTFFAYCKYAGSE